MSVVSTAAGIGNERSESEHLASVSITWLNKQHWDAITPAKAHGEECSGVALLPYHPGVAGAIDTPLQPGESFWSLT